MAELNFPSLFDSTAPGDGPNSTAELHGALCGMLCLNPKASRADWYTQLFEDFFPTDAEKTQLTGLFDVTIQALNGDDYDLKLALADDNAPIATRLIALSDWCLGLSYGLGISGLRDPHLLSDDAQEYLADVLKISQIDTEQVEQTDEEEANLEELTEYLRMGLFVLFSELQPHADPQSMTEH